MTKAHDYMADRQGQNTQLLVSRRQSDAVRLRAAELSRSPQGFLELVIREGLKALEHLGPVPVTHDESNARRAAKQQAPQPEQAFHGRSHFGRDRFGQSDRHGAQGDPATGPRRVPSETPAAPSPSPTTTTDEDTTP